GVRPGATRSKPSDGSAGATPGLVGGELAGRRVTVGVLVEQPLGVVEDVAPGIEPELAARAPVQDVVLVGAATGLDGLAAPPAGLTGAAVDGEAVLDTGERHGAAGAGAEPGAQQRGRHV